MLNFPGASSRQLLHYIDVHLERNKADIVVIDIGVNVFINDNSQSKTVARMSNIKRMVEKCRNYVKKREVVPLKRKK